MLKANIIQKIRFIIGKRYADLEKELDKLSIVAQNNFIRMLKEIENKINLLKKKRLF